MIKNIECINNVSNYAIVVIFIFIIKIILLKINRKNNNFLIKIYKHITTVVQNRM